MEFDKSRAYTAINADELKIDDKVIVADNPVDLFSLVTADSPVYTLSDIKPPSTGCRFVVNKDGVKVSYHLAYLVEKAPENKWRPYKDCAEMTADFKRRYGNPINADNPMWHPLIWLKTNVDNSRVLITQLYDRAVVINGHGTGLSDLFDKYTYLDDSTCGVLLEDAHEGCMI